MGRGMGDGTDHDMISFHVYVGIYVVCVLGRQMCHICLWRSEDTF